VTGNFGDGEGDNFGDSVLNSTGGSVSEGAHVELSTLSPKLSPKLLEAAEAHYRRALTADPKIADALAALGMIAHRRGHSAEGLGLIATAITLNGANPGYHNNASIVLLEIGRPADAEARARAAAEMAPDFALAHYNLGLALHRLGRFAEAEASYRRALELQPDFLEALNNLGLVLSEAGRAAEAVAPLRRALELRPDNAGALNNLGTALVGLGRLDEAAAAYREAVRQWPEFPQAHNNLGCVLLQSGKFEEGWREYEWRWKTKTLAAGARDFAAPQWDGGPLEGRVLLLHAEQGLGDTLQFCRYAAILARRARVVLEAQAPLTRLLARIPGVEAVVARGEALPAFDVHCPLMSAPLALGTTLDTIPGATPYLAADPAEIEAWRERLAGLEGPRIGLAWAGSPREGLPAALAAIDARRSIALAALAPLADVAGVSFVSLQKGPPAGQAADPPPGMTLHDFTADLADFADTAALIENLDLVISVDTSVAHLAGALGKPVWLLNRFDTDWRWMLNRDDSPWYPTLRQFRQTEPGDWAGVVQRVRAALNFGDSVLNSTGGSVSEGAHVELSTLSPKLPKLQSATAIFGQGLTLHRAGKLEAAARAYKKALLKDPNHGDSLNLLGTIYVQTGQAERGVALLERAIRINPNLAESHCVLGVGLDALGRPEEALAAFGRAVGLKPAYVEAHFQRGVALGRLGRHDEALASFDAAIGLDPAMWKAHYNRGLLLHQMGRLEDALASLKQTSALVPEFVEAHFNRGLLLSLMARPEEAVASFDLALGLDPEHVEARLNRSLSLLLAARFEEGWPEYEWRWKHGAMKAEGEARAGFAPRWRGEPLAGRTLLLYAEQGQGDTLHFCRYASLIPPGGRVVLVAQSGLTRVLAHLAGVSQVAAFGTPLPAFDLQCPLLSLPAVFGTTLETIPANVPYLAADPAAAAAWRARLAGLAGLKVGLVWAGLRRADMPDAAAIDARRSLALAALAPLADVAGVSFISLQKGEPAGQAADPPAGMVIHDFTADLHDFADTAALIDALDLVIAVDTSVAHLAGGMGKPVWLLNRFDSCWRWLLNRDDSPWYPTLRQFRQTAPGDWAGVVERVRAALIEFREFR
jgi:tetratricopeptide (TPR) repeat protein